jgi:hypothetical protein
MAGTADNFSTVDVGIGPGKFYIDLGGGTDAWDGAAGVRLILDADGSPDSTQNPNARHVGWTDAGWQFLVKPTFTQFFADESPDPIISRVTAQEAVISGSLLQVMDMDLAEVLNPTLTRSDVMGSTGVTIGNADPQYTSVALIWPFEDDPTRFGVVHLYKAFNDAGLAGNITSREISKSPVAFRGLAVSTRAAADRVGRFFTQNAGAQS